ncbi:DUF5673 domain-containing protein [Anaerococcus tetradius]|jgi:hypothetical protein|uniref:DUF5673 domain-containing protein n=1 Tax=Anaerococcus tetradius ATCC 35098 TaxID=525255 RepID=C2CEZ0_9FIRM|nr:DUF5673 domain-containing protein [Anaerococcus tetradius]EEI83888.1 hypothetical protein HMPREF0077_0050 [Anaerococcus tetradius ATCC 35098]
MGKSLDSMIVILYGAIVVFFLYRIYKLLGYRKSLSGEIKSFDRPSSSFEIILFSVLIITGAVNLYAGFQQGNNKNMLTSVIMIILAFVFMISTKAKLMIGENAIIANSNLRSYKEIRKWGFDTKNSELILLVKDQKGELRETTKVKKEDIEEINSLIRRYKLGK